MGLDLLYIAGWVWCRKDALSLEKMRHPLTRQNVPYGIDKSPPIKNRSKSSSRSQKYEALLTTSAEKKSSCHGPLVLRGYIHHPS